MAPSEARAVVAAYPDSRSGFVAASGATSIGSSPTLNASSVTVGGVTFVTDSGTLAFGDFSSRVPNNEMIISGAENFHVTLPANTFSFGFDIYEPNFVGVSGCNATCFDTNFSIEIFSGATSLGLYNYNAPDDSGTGPVALGFFGVHSQLAFNRVVVRDLANTNDNEMFANFLRGGTAFDPTTPAHGASWGELKVLYR